MTRSKVLLHHYTQKVIIISLINVGYLAHAVGFFLNKKVNVHLINRIHFHINNERKSFIKLAFVERFKKNEAIKVETKEVNTKRIPEAPIAGDPNVA